MWKNTMLPYIFCATQTFRNLFVFIITGEAAIDGTKIDIHSFTKFTSKAVYDGQVITHLDKNDKDDKDASSAQCLKNQGSLNWQADYLDTMRNRGQLKSEELSHLPSSLQAWEDINTKLHLTYLAVAASMPEVY